MDSKSANIKLEVKEEPEYVYVDETACWVKLEEKEDETVKPKQEERVVADIGLCDSEHQPLPGTGQRMQMVKAQRVASTLVQAKRKILPRPQVQIRSLNFGTLHPVPLPVTLPPKALKIKPKKQSSSIKHVSPSKLQSNSCMGRKILPWPHVSTDMAQPQALQSNQSTIPQVIGFDNLQSVATGNTSNVIAQKLPVQQLQPANSSLVQIPGSSQASQPELLASSNLQTVPVKERKLRYAKKRKRSPAPGSERKLLPRPQQIPNDQGGFVSAQHLQAVAPVQTMNSIPVSMPQNIPSQQFPSINSMNIQQNAAPLQSFQGISSVNSQKALSIQQLQSVPDVSLQQTTPFQQLQNVPVANTSQSFSFQQLQSFPTASMHHSKAFQSCPNVAATNSLPILQPKPSGCMHSSLPLQPVPKVSPKSAPELKRNGCTQSDQIDPAQQLHSLQSIQSTSPRNLTTKVAIPQMQHVQPCTRSSVPFQELRSYNAITTQAILSQGQCILSSSGKQNIPLQTIQPINSISNSIPVHQLQSMSNPAGQQQMPLQQLTPLSPDVVSHQAVPIQQLPSSSPLSGQQNFNFQQVQTVPKSPKNTLSIQPSCPVTSANHHVLQVNHVQNITPESTQPSMPIEQIQSINTSVSTQGISTSQFQPIAAKCQQNEVVLRTKETVSGASSIPQQSSLHSLQSISRGSSNLKLALPPVNRVILDVSVPKMPRRQRYPARRRKTPNCEFKKRTILPRPLFPATNIPLQQPAAVSTIAQNIIDPVKGITLLLPQTGSSSAENNEQNPAVLPQTQSALSLNFIPVSDAAVVDGDTPNKVPTFSEGKTVSLLEHVGCLQTSHVESDLPDQLSTQLPKSTFLSGNENSNMEFLESLEENQQASSKISNMISPNTSLNLVSNTSSNVEKSISPQTAHVSVQTFRDLCDDSDMSTEETTDQQEDNYPTFDTTDTSVHPSEVSNMSTINQNIVYGEYGLCNDSVSLSQPKYSTTDIAKMPISSTFICTSTDESEFISGNEERISAEPYRDDINYQEEFTDIPNHMKDSTKQLVTNGNIHDTQNSLMPFVPLNEGQYTSSSLNNMGTLSHYQEQPASSLCEVTQRSLSSVTHDISQEPQVTEVDSNIDQESPLFVTSEEKETPGTSTTVQAEGRCSAEQELNRKSHFLTSHQQNGQVNREHVLSTKGLTQLKRRNGNTIAAQRVNFTSFNSFSRKKTKYSQVSCLKQKLASQEIQIRKLERELEEERKKNEVLASKLLGCNCDGRMQGQDRSTDMNLVTDQVQELEREVEMVKKEQEIYSDDISQRKNREIIFIQQIEKLFLYKDMQQDNLSNAINDFYMQDGVSQIYNKKTKNYDKGMARFSPYYRQVLYNNFLADYCKSCSLEVFRKNIPSNIIKLKASDVNEYFCVTCQNPELKIESMVKRRFLDMETNIEELISSDESWDTFMTALNTLKVRQSKLTYKSWSLNDCDNLLAKRINITKPLKEVVDMLVNELQSLKAHLKHTCKRYDEVYKAKCESLLMPNHAVIQSSWAPWVLLQPVSTNGEPQERVSIHCGYIWSKEEVTGFIALSDSKDRTAAAVCASLEKALMKMISKGIKLITFIVDPQTDMSCVCEYAHKHNIETKQIFLEPGHSHNITKSLGNRIAKLFSDFVKSKSCTSFYKAQNMFELISSSSDILIQFYTDEHIQQYKEPSNGVDKISFIDKKFQ